MSPALSTPKCPPRQRTFRFGPAWQLTRCGSASCSGNGWIVRSPADLAVAVEADRLGYREVWVGEMAKLDAPAMAAAIVARTDSDRAVPRAVGGHRALAGADRARRVDGRGHGTHDARRARDVEPPRRRLARAFAVDGRAGAAGGGDGGGARAARRRPGQRLPPAPAAAGRRRSRSPRSGPGRWRSPPLPTGWCSTWSRSTPSPSWRRSHRTRPHGCRPRSTRRPQERRWLSLGLVGLPRRGRLLRRCSRPPATPTSSTSPASRPHPKELAARLPEGLIEAVGLVGSADEVAARMAQYEAAGLAEVGLVVPPLDSPSGRRTLEALAP